MRSKGIFVTVVIVLAFIFTAFNWQSLSYPLPINLLFFQIPVPLGLFLIGTVIIVSLLFLLLSLFRRAGQLRHIMHIERQLDDLQGKLEKRRFDEIIQLEKSILARLDGLETHLTETDSGFRTAVSEHTSHIEAHERAQAERLEERVMLMRNELAANIAQVETSLKRSLPSSRTFSSSDTSTRSSTPDIMIVEGEVKRVP